MSSPEPNRQPTEAAAASKSKSDDRRAQLEAFRAAQAAKKAASLGHKVDTMPATAPAKSLKSRQSAHLSPLVDKGVRCLQSPPFSRVQLAHMFCQDSIKLESSTEGLCCSAAYKEAGLTQPRATSSGTTKVCSHSFQHSSCQSQAAYLCKRPPRIQGICSSAIERACS